MTLLPEPVEFHQSPAQSPLAWSRCAASVLMASVLALAAAPVPAQAPQPVSAPAAAVAPAPADAPAPAAQGDATRAREKVSMCIGCHSIPNYKTAFPIVYPVPRIGGQGEGYIVAALQAYKKGERHHPTMRAIAQSLSDQDIADVAAYYSAQH